MSADPVDELMALSAREAPGLADRLEAALSALEHASAREESQAALAALAEEAHALMLWAATLGLTGVLELAVEVEDEALNGDSDWAADAGRRTLAALRSLGRDGPQQLRAKTRA
jgi:hypothetical protein